MHYRVSGFEIDEAEEDNSLTLHYRVSGNEIDDAEEDNSLTHSEAIDELFATTYDSLRDTNGNCITKTRDLIGKLVQSLMFICSTINLRLSKLNHFSATLSVRIEIV